MRLTEAIEGTKPVALKQGDTIGITAPSSQISIGSVSTFARHLESLGFKVLLGETITTVTDKDYNSGDVNHRAEDLNAMIEDKNVRAIFAGAGGFGAQKTAHHIDYDSIARDPKPIVGFSDTTFLLNSITAATHITTFLGPTAEITDINRDPKSIELCLNMLMGNIKQPFEYRNLDGCEIRRISEPGMTGIGRIVGGNLTMCQTTLGTDYEIDTDNKILLLEEVSESSYAIERMLDHLMSAGKFDNVKGVVFGEFSDVVREPVKEPQDSNPSVMEILVKKFKKAPYPVLIGYNFSHGAYNLTLPIGGIAKLDSSSRSLTLIDSVVK